MYGLIALAEVTQKENQAVNNFAEYPSVAGLFFRVVFTLLFILFIVYLVMKLIRKQNILRQNQKTWIKILDYQALGLNRGLYLMELYDMTCIVSICEGEINILKEIDTTDEKWFDVKDSIALEEDIVSKGIGKIFRGEINRGNFQKQLEDQINRSKYLSLLYKKRRDKVD
jgi:flagellar biogenesis protein FliO